MNPFKYVPPRVNTGELRTRVTFFEYAPSEGPEPGEEKKKTLYEPWAKVEEVWMRDVEDAKANGTLTDVTIVIRDPLGDYWPTNKHRFEIHSREYEGVVFEIERAQPDLQNHQFVNVIGQVSS